MNCCSDETTSQTFSEVLRSFVSMIKNIGKDSDHSYSDIILSVLFAIHVIIVVAFLISHCRPVKAKNKASSTAWLRRQANDPFVKAALRDGYRARSAYKLIEINDRFKILKPGQVVVECGAAPGAWTQVCTELINAKEFSFKESKKKDSGIIVGCDLLDIEPVPGAVLFPHCDFTHPDSQNQISNALKGNKIDVVLSDMAPNASGMGSMDSDSLVKLAYSAFRFAALNSKLGATFVCKVFSGSSAERLRSDLVRFYNLVDNCKPKSSRKESAEIYFVARDFKGVRQKS